MASEPRLARGLWMRLGVLLGAMTAAAAAMARPDLVAAKVVALAICVLLASELTRYLRRTNGELARFVEALEHADLSQSFSAGDDGLGLGELARALSLAMQRVRDSRVAVAAEARFFRALVEHVPLPLLAIDAAERVELLNSAARRLFGAPQLVSLEGLRAYGDRLWRDLREERPGRRRLTEMTIDGARQSMTLAVAQLEGVGGSQRIVSLQNIQGELDANELAVWRELVRVLTHEIMNSLTPLTSLAKTAAGTLARADGNDDALADARMAVETLERRADRLMDFVQSYRRLTRLPPPRPVAFALEPFLAEVTRVFRARWPEGEVKLEAAVEPSSLELFADAQQIEQALQNLLNNAAQAAVERVGSAAGVRLTARRDRLDRVVIEVADNGPGVPGAIRDSIFLPFFTTKASGTGVGLSLTRQIALAHGAAITVGDRDGGGALLRLTFGAR